MSLSAWLEWVMMRVRSVLSLWYSVCRICTAVSVFPDPGGPTTRLRPGCRLRVMAATCALVNSTCVFAMGETASAPSMESLGVPSDAAGAGAPSPARRLASSANVTLNGALRPFPFHSMS